MSKTESDLEEYRGTAGAEVKTADVASESHALRSIVDGDGGTKERIYDAQQAGERFVNFYDDAAAAIREYLSNSETACIRRARYELIDAGFSEDEIPSEVSEILDLAKEECDYEPLIEVTYNRKADATRFIIEDNGIGISTEEYQVVQRIGYSTSHQQGNRLGNFGIGWMSGFQLTSVNGMFKMSTKSRLTDEAYSTAEYVANFEMLDGEPDEYGTRFEFPGFGEAAKEIDIPSKVQEYAEGMTIPVLYRDFDHDGQETHRSDDYLATRMEDDYADDSLVVIYEDEYFKAVMSPDRKESGRGTTTYNISMPIRRNTDAFGSNKFNAPWKWDFRAKQENGPIVSCPSDESLVGMVPKENTKYDRLMPELQEKCVPMSEVPDDAISMPEPASSRDSFMGGHDDFWKYVSTKLNDEWRDVAKERFESLDSWDDFLSMERDEKHGLFRAYSQFGPSYTDAEPDTIQETLEDELGVTLDTDLCEKLHKSQSKVSVVARGSSRAHTKGATTSKQIWKVIDEAPDGIYMGKTISQKKAEIVWGLGETHIVRLSSSESYNEYEDDWGWDKAKDLPHTNLKEKLPELDDDVAEKFENVSDSQSNNTSRSSTGGNGQDPTTYRGKTRVGSGSSKYFTTWKLDNLVEKLEDDDPFSAGKWTCDKLTILPDSKSAELVASKAYRSRDVAAMRLPKYAYQYMVGKDNVYESMDEIRAEMEGVEIELSDGTEMDIRDIPSTDCILVTPSKYQSEFEGREDDLVELLDYDSSDFERYTWAKAEDFNGAWEASTDATVIAISGYLGTFNDFNDYNVKRSNFREIKMKDHLGKDVDQHSDEFEALFGYRYGEATGSTLDTLLEVAERAGLPKTDDQ
jgi:hypothetical protein